MRWRHGLVSTRSIVLTQFCLTVTRHLTTFSVVAGRVRKERKGSRNSRVESVVLTRCDGTKIIECRKRKSFFLKSDGFGLRSAAISQRAKPKVSNSTVQL